MGDNFLHLKNKIFSNNEKILSEILNDLKQLVGNSKDDLIIKTLKNVIIQINNMINDNKKNYEFIKNNISKLYNQTNINNQELQCENGRYIGQVVNGLREGKGIYYVFNGDRYEGDWKNDKREGKGQEYFNNGDIYKGKQKNGLREGKGVELYHSGNKYEGDFKESKKEGKGIFYWYDGDRYEGLEK